MASFATLSEFETRKGDVPTEQEGMIDALLEDASALILDEAAGSTANWVVDQDDAPNSIRAICIEVAYRAWRNPDALSSQVLGSAEFAYRASEPDALYLTERECRTIRRLASSGGFRSVTLASPYSGDDSVDSCDPLLDGWGS